MSDNQPVIDLINQTIAASSTVTPDVTKRIVIARLSAALRALGAIVPDGPKPEPRPVRIGSIVSHPQASQQTDQYPATVTPNRNTLEEYHAMWNDLHTRLDADEAWDADFDKRLKCSACSSPWARVKKENPPVYGASRYEWTVKVHNLVNAELGKPLWG